VRKKNHQFKNAMSRSQRIINYIFLILVFITMFLPLWNVFVMSTSTALDAGSSGIKLWWKSFSMEGYEFIFKNMKIATPLKNSIIVSVSGTMAQVLLASLAGYVLVQNDIPFKNAITSFIMLTMMIPGDLTLISIYQLNKQLGFLNSYIGLIINGLVSGFCILLMRNYFLSVPYSLAESARIDGSSEFKIFYKIYLPLSGPGLATITFLEFVSKWNSVMIPATITTDSNYFTLPLVLRNLVAADAALSGAPLARDNAIMAAIVITTIPLLLIYVFAQRFLLSGMTLGATKE